MTGSADRADRIEELVFQCLDTIEGAADAEARVDALLAGESPAVRSAVRRALAEVSAFVQRPATNTFAELHLPERLGPYTLGACLGRGGMGAVYEGLDPSLSRRVALKVIRPDLLLLGGARERFRREIAVIARLSHPGIVPVYQVGEDDGVPWFAMELLTGASLAEVLARLQRREPASLAAGDLIAAACGDGQADAGPGKAGRSSGNPIGEARGDGTWERACLRLGREVAEALTHAHGRSVLHRDVKPSNVFVDVDGRARLLDFGLAHADDDRELTRTGAVLGSLPYVPPERLRGDVEADARGDVYSLAVTLHEALTLRSPFLGASEEATRRNIAAAQPTPLRRLLRTVSWETATVVAVAMDPDPARRYQSMAEFAAELQRVLDRRPIVARPPGIALRLRRAAQRHPVVATTTVVGVLALVAMFLVYTLGLQHERDRAVAAQQAAEHLRIVDRQRSYASGVQAAQLALRLGQSAAAVRQLEQCPAELRAFEWFHLRRQVDESLTRIAVSDAFVRRVVATAGGVFAAGADGLVRRVDPSDGTAAAFEQVTTASVLAMTASPDGRHVLTGHLDHAARLWDGATGALRATIEFDDLYDGRELAARHRSCYAVALAPDGRSARAMTAGGAVATIDLERGERTGGFLLPLGRGGMFAVAVAPAGDLLAVGHDHDVLLVDGAGGLMRTLQGHRGFVFSLQFSPDGQHLLSGSQDRTARVWRVADGSLDTVLFGHDGEVHQAAFVGERRVWTASNDGSLRSFELPSGRELRRLLGHEGAVYGVAAMAGDARLVSAGWDGTVRVWEGEGGRARRRIGAAGRTLRPPLVLHDEGTRVTVLDDGEGVRTFALPDGAPMPSLVEGKVRALAVRGSVVAALRDDGIEVRPAGRRLTLPTAAAAAIEQLTWLDDSLLAGGAEDGAVWLWSMEAAPDTPPERLGAHSARVTMLLPVGGELLSAGHDGRVLRWRRDGSGALAPSELLRRDNVWDDGALSPDGRILFVAGLRRVTALDLNGVGVVWERELATRCRGIATASGGRRLLLAGADRVLHVLDAHGGDELLGLPADNLLQAVSVAGDVAVTATVYSEIDLWSGR